MGLVTRPDIPSSTLQLTKLCLPLATSNRGNELDLLRTPRMDGTSPITLHA